MTPTSSNDTSDFKITIQPSLSYKLKFNKERVEQYINGIEAVKQAIYKILLTNRYKYEIYNWNYGIELNDLFGQQKEYVYSEIERRIKDALLQDNRIEDVYDFKFPASRDKDKSTVCVEFSVKTIFGQIDIQSELNI